MFIFILWVINVLFSYKGLLHPATAAVGHSGIHRPLHFPVSVYFLIATKCMYISDISDQI